MDGIYYLNQICFHSFEKAVFGHFSKMCMGLENSKSGHRS
jgi:hypothetical protein